MSEISIIRNNENQIISYLICTNTKRFTLNREDIEKIYRFYTNTGAKLTAQNVRLKFFQNYTTDDFTKILQALKKHYSFSKSSSIFTPHEDEELTDQEKTKIAAEFISDLRRLKDQNETINWYKCALTDTQSKLKNQEDLIQQILNAIKHEDQLDEVKYIHDNTSKKLAIWLSDMHIGCRVDSDRATMNENVGWNLNEALQRINKIVEHVSQFKNLSEIWVFNLGDAIDGLDSTTTRRDVKLPQNMSNFEMFQGYKNCIMQLFASLRVNFPETKLMFRSVASSNHGGSGEMFMSYAIAEILKTKGVDASVASKDFGFTKINNTLVAYFHGKNSEDQKSPMPPTLDAKTKEYLQSVISNNNLSEYKGRILFVKGDSHQKALTATDDFEYLSVGSMFGGSNWAQANFPTRRWEVNYSIFENNIRVDGSIKDNDKKIIQPEII